MSYTNFTATLDIGTSKITLTLATKTTSGDLNIIDVESSPTVSVKHGRIINENSLARLIRKIILRVQQRQSTIIEQIYVTTSGTLLYTEAVVISKELGEGSIIQEGTLDALQQQCIDSKKIRDGYEILSTNPIEYHLDGELTDVVVGSRCSTLQCTYILTIVKSESINKIKNTLRIAEIRLAGLLSAPEVIAEATLTERDKKVGTAAIEIGHSCTKIAIYQNNKIRFASTIPLGSNLITNDLEKCFNLDTDTAQKVKEHPAIGSLCSELVEDVDVSLTETNDIKKNRAIRDIVEVIEARTEEILLNIMHQIETSHYMYLLSGGLVFSGGITSISNLEQFVQIKTNFNSRIADIKLHFAKPELAYFASPLNAETVGMLKTGTLNCRKAIVRAEKTETTPLREKQYKKEEPKEKSSIFKEVGNIFQGFFESPDNAIDE